MRKLLLPAVALLCSTQANAVTVVPFSTLPTDIRNCFQTGNCYDEMSYGGNIESTFDTTGAAAFEYWQRSGSTYQHKWLMRYDLHTPPGTVSGIAWLTMQDTYDIAGSDSHEFTLYHPGNYDPAYLTYGFSLNDADLADGSAFRKERVYMDFNGDIVLGVWGNLMPDAPMDYCFDIDFCWAMDIVNLAHINYVNGIFNFNPVDTRELLFHSYDGFDAAIENELSLYVAPAVPLPASALLFTSGLVGGALSLRRKNATTA